MPAPIQLGAKDEKLTLCANFRGWYKKWVSLHKEVTQQPSVKVFQDGY